MVVPNEIATDRLIMRRWKAADRAPYAALNADPEVREHFPDLLTAEQSDASIDQFEAQWDERGYGLFALERRDTGEFIGHTGLHYADFEVSFLPGVEIGWRLARSAWGHGFATEAALAALWFGFEQRKLDEILSFTSVTNRPSQRVMQRIGMTRDRSNDFDHPRVAEDSPLRAHVLFRLARADWTG